MVHEVFFGIGLCMFLFETIEVIRSEERAKTKFTIVATVQAQSSLFLFTFFPFPKCIAVFI
jgi:hypothetical protein